jgi:hypothetical protein
VLAALLAGALLFMLALRRELRGLSPARAAYVRLGRLAAWAGLEQEPHTTPHEYADTLARRLPQQGDAVRRIAGAYVADRYSPAGSADAEQLERDLRALRQPLLGRMLGRIGGLARPAPRRRRVRVRS